MVEVKESRELTASEVQWLKENDLSLFLAKAKRSQVRKRFKGVCAADFKADVNRYCSFFGQRVKRTAAKSLTTRKWRTLQVVIEKLGDVLKGRPIEEAERIIGTRVGVNRVILNGLTGKHQPWKSC